MAATQSLPIMHLSLITGGVLRDRAGGQPGRVDDVVVRLGVDYPVVSPAARHNVHVHRLTARQSS